MHAPPSGASTAVSAIPLWNSRRSMLSSHIRRVATGRSMATV